MSSAGPASMEPAGAPSPFERQNITVSAGATMSLHGHTGSGGGIEDARAVHVDLDCRARARLRRFRWIASQRVDRAAVHVVRVFDRDQAGGRPKRAEGASYSRRTASQERMPFSVGMARTTQPENHATMPSSQSRTWARESADHFLAVLGVAA